jgi:NAD(P)-dependent dehydrogenase (short-subunit alcohol dehydrogenase family)
MRIDLTGEVAFVTGAASGIGLGAASALKSCGARVVGADRDRKGLENAGENALDHALSLDVTDSAAVENAVAEAERLAGPITVLVTAAGIPQRQLLPENTPDSEWNKVISTNLTGSWLCAKAVGPRMAARGRGAIVLVSSVMGSQPGPIHAYSAAKAGIDALTKGLAAEWGRAGVRVNAVAPGFVETPLLEKALHFNALDADQLRRTAALVRLLEAPEIAAAIAFLACPLASGVTGAVLPVDAGFLASAGFRAFPGRG